MDKPTAFDPATADRLLGTWYHRVAGLLSGSRWDLIERDGEYRVVYTPFEGRAQVSGYSASETAARLAFVSIIATNG
jgi:hypothetical protein